jgi:N-acetylglutamate synthase/N-acetylornithine aminotransferase
MTLPIASVPNGTVTSARGFSAGGVFAGIKTPGPDKLDIGLLISDHPCNVAGTFSQNSIISPTVTLTSARVGVDKQVRALVVNSGCANTAVGEQGITDAKEMTELAATKLGVTSEETLVCSTGVIGVEIPMALMREFIPQISTIEDGGNEFARAILTTDKRTKEIAVSFDVDGVTHTVGGVSKGSGMIHPNIAIEIARDGEGATKLIEVTVEGAHTEDDALLASRECASSLLVKTAVYGRDPNWGRIFMAVGKAEIPLDESKIDVFVNDIQIVADGKAIAYNIQSVVSALGGDVVRLRVDLKVGNGYGRAWGCDLTEEYVVFNSAYTT